MILIFAVQFGNGDVASVPLAFDASQSLLFCLKRLGQKLDLPIDTSSNEAADKLFSPRSTVSGEPVPIVWSKPPFSQSPPLQARDVLYLILRDESRLPSKTAQLFIRASNRPHRMLSQHKDPAAPATNTRGSDANNNDTAAPMGTDDGDVVEDLPRINVEEPISRQTAPPLESSVRVLGPNKEDAADASSDDGGEQGEDPASRTVVLGAAKALFLRRHDNKVTSTMSAQKHAMGRPICVETPELCGMFPSELVQTVRANELLRTRTYDPSAETIPSTLSGVSDGDFAKALSIARTHGHVVKVGGEAETKVALYPTLSCVKHSCFPNAVMMVQQQRPPFAARLVCCTASGIEMGDEINIVLPAVAGAPEFLLLPRDRRQKYLQKRYHFTCDCLRCKKSSEPLSPEDEKRADTPCPSAQLVARMGFGATGTTITGAFFSEESTSDERKAAAEAMRSSFNALGLLDEDSPPDEQEGFGLLMTEAGRQGRAAPAEKLSQFLKDYSPSISATKKEEGTKGKTLTLHRHHWRLSFARIALLRTFDPDVGGGHAGMTMKPVASVKAPINNKTNKTAATAGGGKKKPPATAAAAAKGAAASPLAPRPLDPVAFDAAIEQLATETALLPSGHPHMLRTFQLLTRSFSAVKDPNVVRLVQRRMLQKISLDWSVLSDVAKQASAFAAL